MTSQAATALDFDFNDINFALPWDRPAICAFSCFLLPSLPSSLSHPSSCSHSHALSHTFSPHQWDRGPVGGSTSSFSRAGPACLTGLQEEVQCSDGLEKPLCGFLQHTAELQMENRKTFPLPCLSMQSPCWRFSWEMIFQPFHPAGILTPGMD